MSTIISFTPLIAFLVINIWYLMWILRLALLVCSAHYNTAFLPPSICPCSTNSHACQQRTLQSLSFCDYRPSLTPFSFVDCHCCCRRRRIDVDASTTALHGVVSETTRDDNHQQQQQQAQQEPKRRFMYMTEAEDLLLKEKGEREQSLMKRPVPLKPNKVRGTSGGFGGGAGGSHKNARRDRQQRASCQEQHDEQAAVAAHAAALQTDGIVRIDKVLSDKLAANLRDYLVDLRARATAQVESGEIQDSMERFADVLLNQNRCDLKIPLGPAPVHEALYHLLAQSVVGKVIEYVYDSYGGVGKEATLWELNCFMSNAVARRQLVHADCVCLEPVVGLEDGEPIMLTCFVALQDIDEAMGPTVWMPGTHTLQAHNQFFETGIDAASTRTDAASPKDKLLRSSKSLMGTIPQGSCVIFDPRVLHCAGGNSCPDPEKTRALFYVSFKNPKVDSPGSPSTSGYGIATADLTLEDLVNDLVAENNGETPRRLPLLSHFP